MCCVLGHYYVHWLPFYHAQRLYNKTACGAAGGWALCCVLGHYYVQWLPFYHAQRLHNQTDCGTDGGYIVPFYLSTYSKRKHVCIIKAGIIKNPYYIRPIYIRRSCITWPLFPEKTLNRSTLLSYINRIKLTESHCTNNVYTVVIF